jgi:AraC-like DNA-binding protein
VIFSACEPPAALAGAVKTIWVARGLREEFETPEPIIPDGCVEMVFNLGDRFADGATGELQPRDLLAGQMTGPVVARPTGRVDLIGVRFRSSRAGAALRTPIGELRDCITAASGVLPGAIQVVDRLRCTPVPHRLEVLTRELAPRLRAIDDGRLTAVEHALAVIHARRGRVGIEAVADAAGVSRRHLERQFHDEVGLGVKDMARIVRLHAALVWLDRAPALSGADIAARCGYSDQAHLVRECRSFTGRTPTRFAGDRSSLAMLIRES